MNFSGRIKILMVLGILIALAGVAIFGYVVFSKKESKEVESQSVVDIQQTENGEEKIEDEDILREIRIIPMGIVSSEDVVLLRQILKQNFFTTTVQIHIVEPRDLPQSAFDQSRNQYNAKSLIQSFEKTGHPSVRLVGVIDEDMYVPGLPFVFSIAKPEGNSVILSTQRLREDYSGKTLYRYDGTLEESAEVISLAEEGVTRQRYRKSIMRALGLTFGFKPAPDTSCMMAFSNNLYELDRKRTEWCGEEREMIQSMQGISPENISILTKWKTYATERYQMDYPPNWTVQIIDSAVTLFSGKATNDASEQQCKLFHGGSDPDRKPSSTWSFQGLFDVPIGESDTEARIYRETTDDLFYLLVGTIGDQLKVVGFEGQMYGKTYENCLEVFKSMLLTFERIEKDEEEGQARAVLLQFLQARKQNNLESIAQLVTERGMQQLQKVPLTFIGTENYEIKEGKKVTRGLYEFYITIPRVEELSLLSEIDGGYAVGELIEVQKFPDGYYVNGVQETK